MNQRLKIVTHHVGYYRVNYDETMWRRIIAVLTSSNRTVIHEINRASLMDDLLNLGRVGYVDYDIVLAGTRYLSEETAYAPWKAAYSGFAYLSKRFAQQEEVYDAYKVRDSATKPIALTVELTHIMNLSLTVSVYYFADLSIAIARAGC